MSKDITDVDLIKENIIALNIRGFLNQLRLSHRLKCIIIFLLIVKH